MAFPTSDRWYQDEYEPPTILAMRAPLCAAYQRPAAAFGCRGDTDHTSGYHRSRSFIVNSPYSTQKLGDYSIQSTLDTSEPDWSLCSAFDFVPGSWGSVDNRVKMARLTQRLLNAARARDPRLAALREIAGTLDGRTVTRFRCSDGVILSPFDSSHLDHIHGSFWRSRAKRNHSGIVEIMIGDDDMLTGEQAQQLTNIHDWMFDYCRGLIAADPGTPHIVEYVPNKWIKGLYDRPPVVPAPVDTAALAAELAGNAAFIAALADAVAAQVVAALPTEAQREQDAFEGAQRAEGE